MKKATLALAGATLVLLSACVVVATQDPARGPAPAAAQSGTTSAEPPSPPSPAPALTPDNPEVILATTTSTQDTGLLDVLLPMFECQTGYRVKAIAVGTGQALALGARGSGLEARPTWCLSTRPIQSAPGWQREMGRLVDRARLTGRVTPLMPVNVRLAVRADAAEIRVFP